MAEEELQIIRLRDDFYRDGFYKALAVLLALFAILFLLVMTSLYLFFTKPSPVGFSADNEWRILPPVPVNQPYLKAPDLIQWVANVMPTVFNYGYLNYAETLKGNAPYFTDNGWKKFLEFVNTYADYNSINSSKVFINATPSGAPFILNSGLLEGRYAWWVQIPLNIIYSGASQTKTVSVVFQVLVVRIPTINNLYGVAIENMVVPKSAKGQNTET